MQTLSYGFKKPGTGDTGAPVFTAMADNFQKLNDHDHDGSDSARLSPASTLVSTVAVLAAGWVDQGSGTYRQLVTMPGALKYDEVQIGCKITSSLAPVHPTIEKVSATTFYVYTNDNSLGYTLVFSS